MKKKFYLFFLTILLLVSSPFLIRYLLINQKIGFLNRIYFNFPGIIIRKKICPNLDTLLNETLDNSFSVSIINENGVLISSYNDEVLRLPASNQKLFSSAYVLDKYKLDANLKTSLLKKEMILIQIQLREMNKFFLSHSIYKFTKIDSLSGLISNSFLKKYLLFSSLKSNQLFG